MEGSDSAALLKLLTLAMDLKRVKRQGWIDRGVDDPESVADHSWGVALLAWALAVEHDDLDRDRVLLLGLVHDLPEALAGDTTPFDSDRDSSGLIASEHFERPPEYSAELDRRKRERESAALDEMLADIREPLAGEIRSAWWEYELAESAEARFVKQIDKLETVLQSERYRARQPGLVMDSFRRGAQRDMVDPRLVELLTEIMGEPGD